MSVDSQWKNFMLKEKDLLEQPISWWSLKRLLKRAFYRYRLVKKSLKVDRDKILFALFTQEIKHQQSA
jgi:hypothetical protein